MGSSKEATSLTSEAACSKAAHFGGDIPPILSQSIPEKKG